MEDLGIIVGIIVGILTIAGMLYSFVKWLTGKAKKTALDSRIQNAASKPAGDEHQIDDADEDLSPLEDEILVTMSKADHPALISEHFQMPRHLVIAGKKFVDENDDLYRLECLEAMDELLDESYIDETGDGVYRLTARGLVRAREQDCEPQPKEERTLVDVADDPLDEPRMKKYLDSLSSKEFFGFYHSVMETRGVHLMFGRLRPSYTKEILDCKTLDPGRWAKAGRLSGVEAMHGNDA